MKAIVSLKVEVIEGDDKGYILQEENRLTEFKESPAEWWGDVRPYRISIDFFTPSLYQKAGEQCEN